MDNRITYASLAIAALSLLVSVYSVFFHDKSYEHKLIKEAEKFDLERRYEYIKSKIGPPIMELSLPFPMYCNDIDEQEPEVVDVMYRRWGELEDDFKIQMIFSANDDLLGMVIHTTRIKPFSYKYMNFSLGISSLYDVHESGTIGISNEDARYPATIEPHYFGAPGKYYSYTFSVPMDLSVYHERLRLNSRFRQETLPNIMSVWSDDIVSFYFEFFKCEHINDEQSEYIQHVYRSLVSVPVHWFEG